MPLHEIQQTTAVLTRSFYSRPTAGVARDLLGKILVHRGTAGRIVEVEAYLGVNDRAAHAFRGLTPRTNVLFGPPGHAYVYLIYGRYECLNIVAEPEGIPGCVLVRAVEPLAGIGRMRARRGGEPNPARLASGPGRLSVAMGITRRLNGADLTRGPLTIRRWIEEPPVEVDVTARIGIRHARDWPLRFILRGSPAISRRMPVLLSK